MSKINIKVQGQDITVIRLEEDDFISLTNLAGAFSESNNLISKWISNKNTLEYLGLFETIHNMEFNYPEFDVIKNASGVNRFTMSVGQWLGRTSAKGFIVKAGKYGGTYAHKDIAFHFAMWLSPHFNFLLLGNINC
ncbi:MAG: KilA-N domain-containing protein [Saprospiraceae bacterium]